jgi:flagellar export protein FliJ
MPFRYRLQKVLDFRINQKEEQLMRVQKAQQAVTKAEDNIKKNNQLIVATKEGMRTADPTMYDYYDKYLKHLWEEAERLEQIRIELQKQLDIELQKLVKCEQNVKVLEKHKEKNRELYLQEEKQAELKQFSELGVTRFFRKIQDQRIEEEREEQK